MHLVGELAGCAHVRMHVQGVRTCTCIGLSITLKAGGLMPRWLWGAVAQWSEHLQLRICGALVQFGRHQHRCELGKGSVVF